MPTVFVEVDTEAQAKAVKLAVAMPDVRAFLIIIGTLAPLRDRAQARVLRSIAEALQEDEKRGQ
jgi:hypothetical protein